MPKSPEKSTHDQAVEGSLSAAGRHFDGKFRRELKRTGREHPGFAEYSARVGQPKTQAEPEQGSFYAQRARVLRKP